jgi:hypothetical protein
MWMWSLTSRETAREEVFWSLAVLAIVLLMRHLLMRVFSARLRSLFHPWAEARLLKGHRSRWTGIPRYPEHRQQSTNKPKQRGKVMKETQTTHLQQFTRQTTELRKVKPAKPRKR